MRDARRLQAIWHGEATAPMALRLGLGAAACAWEAGRSLHRALYRASLLRRQRLAVPVVSVGNLSVGGVGKTPFVAALARMQVAAGRLVLIVARGFGRAPGAELNDEGMWLRAAVPQARIVQAPDRAAAARRALAESPADLVLLDDGFQHEALARDLDLVLVDATAGFGNGRLLPAGPLRERPSALRRADFVVLTRCKLATGEEFERTRTAVAAAAPGVPLVTTRFEVVSLRHGDERLKPTDLRGRDVVVATGVGHPAAVARTVAGIGAIIVEQVRYADHHRYERNEFDALLAGAHRRNAALVTTAKDAVKWHALAPEWARHYFVLEQDCAFVEGREGLESALNRLLSARPTGQSGRSAGTGSTVAASK